ncbi:MAG: transposase [Leptolyngbya sp. IPPAS B-1204]
MASTSRLYDALNDFLRQSDIVWQDARHLQTLCWMIIGMIESQNVHLNGFGVYVTSRAQIAQSHQRRFRRWLSNRRIDVVSAHHALVRQALSEWGSERLYLSLDTTVVWNCFCIVWVGVVYRGRTVPVAWRVVAQASSTVRLWTIQRVLRQSQRVLPEGVTVVLLADRGFADGKLMKYLRDNLGWHFRIRIKRSFRFQLEGQWCKVSEVQLQPGQAYFTPVVSIGKTKPCPNVYLAFAHDKLSDEDWTSVSDEPTTLQTFAQYRLRFCVEESFFRFEVQRVQSRSLQTTGQIRPVPVVRGDCRDDAIPDFARGECGGIRQAASSGCSLETRYELSENGLELDSPCHHSAVKNPSASISFQ